MDQAEDQPHDKIKNFELPTADQAEEIFHTALAAGDARGVEAALRILAVRDPHRAETLYTLVKVALKLARETQA